MTTNYRNTCRRRSKSDGGMKEKAKDSVVSRSTFGSILCTWLKKRKKVIPGSHQYQSKDDALYRSSTSLKNLVDNDNDNDEATMSVSEEDCPQPQSYDTTDSHDDALDDSLSTVMMSELSQTSRRLVYEALEYHERCLRIQTQPVLNQKKNSDIE